MEDKLNDISAYFGLPEVEIYPQNQWGDIARREGVNTANKWAAVKNAVYKGQRDFIENPRTQFVMATLPVSMESAMAEVVGGAAAPYIAKAANKVANSSVGKAVGRAVSDKANKFAKMMDELFPGKELKQATKEFNNSIDNLTFKIKDVTGGKEIAASTPKTSASAGKTNYSMLERPSKISAKEKAGVTKAERNPARHSYYDKTDLNESEHIAHEFPRINENTKDYVTDYGLFNKKKLNLDDIREYVSSLPEPKTPIDKITIQDYRRYLANIGYENRQLKDNELAKIIADQYEKLQVGQTGKLKGTVMYHGSPNMFDTFDYGRTGEFTGNMGNIGPGNYFSTGRSPYGMKHHYDTLTGKYTTKGNIQPYLINNVKSVPNRHTLLRKELIPKYYSPPNPLRSLGTLRPSIWEEQGTRLAPDYMKDPFYVEWYEKAMERKDVQNYLKHIKNINNNWKLNKDAFILDITHAGPSRTMIPTKDGKDIYAVEGMLHRNDGIKSLFPHPSTLKRGEDGKLFFDRSWSDPRVNY